MPSPSPLHPTTTRRRARGLIAGLAALGVALSALSMTGTAEAAKKKTASTIVSPGNFSGYGFDQCVAPTQSAMTTWMNSSPYLAVGIYISGNSRHCRTQPNLSATWVDTQLKAGWKLLPIVLGPQASCSTRYPKYKDDPTISANKANNYSAATTQGTLEARKSAADATRYGIPKRSTLWYDLEAFNISNTACRESALRFVSAWNAEITKLGYVSGFYSSAASGIKMLDDARKTRPTAFTLPAQIWIADWDKKANTSSQFVRADGWPAARMKQYIGGHNETWGGVRINIDTNYLSFGQGSRITMPRPCGSTNINLTSFTLVNKNNKRTDQIRAMQCVLKVRGLYKGPMDGRLTRVTKKAVANFQRSNRQPVGPWTATLWMRGFAKGATPVLKVGSASTAVLRVQRALNATSVGRVPVTGTYDAATKAAVIRYQKALRHSATGIVTAPTWAALQAGRVV